MAGKRRNKGLTTQPSYPAQINPYWLSRGLVFLNLGNGLYWQKGLGWMGTGTIAGTPKNVTGKLGVAKGFGATSGTGTTDRIDVGVRPVGMGTARSVVAHVYANSLGGGSLGRVFQATTGTGLDGGDESLFILSSTMSYVRRSSGATGQWRTSSLPTGALTCVGVSLDETAIGTTPVMYVDGVVSSTNTTSNTSGSYTQLGTTLAWGNRPSDSDSERNWDGLIGPVAFFDAFLTAGEHKALNDNIWQLLSGRRKNKVAAGGGSTITPANGTSTTSTISGGSNVAASITSAAGITSAASITASATAATALTSAAGVSTTGTLAGAAVTAAAITSASGITTASSLTASATAASALTQAAGITTASSLTASSTAAAALTAVAGVSTTGTLASVAGASSITPADGTSTTSTLAGSSVSAASITSAAGQTTTGTLSSAGVTAAAMVPASGVTTASTFAASAVVATVAIAAAGASSAATIAARSDAFATFGVASGVSTTATLVNADGVITIAGAIVGNRSSHSATSSRPQRLQMSVRPPR